MPDRPSPKNDVAIIAIGRNEGQRLVRCLESAVGQARRVVYVDSGSSDESMANAARIGAEVLELDRSRPFSAARARNFGFESVRADPSIKFVQYVDGDCEFQPGWIEAGLQFLVDNPEAGVVAGRRRERFPEASPYNRLVDLDWAVPPGVVTGTGSGDALMRREAVEDVGGFDADLIAGEDPEMYFRIRRAGWTVHVIDEEMTLHDADMKEFGQWWQRAVRNGHACAECAHLHSGGPEGYRQRELRSILVWGGAVPAVSMLGALPTMGLSTGVLASYGLLWKKIHKYRMDKGDPPGEARLYAAACTLGKVAEFQGVLKYAWNHFVRKKRTGLIEYKK